MSVAIVPVLEVLEDLATIARKEDAWVIALHSNQNLTEVQNAFAVAVQGASVVAGRLARWPSGGCLSLMDAALDADQDQDWQGAKLAAVGFLSQDIPPKVLDKWRKTANLVLTLRK